MATSNKKYLDDQGLSTVANYVKERLKTVSAMPVSAGNGTVLLYTGATSGSYENGHIYQYNTTTSTWTDISPSGSGGASIYPTPSSSVTESQIVNAVNAAQNTNENTSSLYGMQVWSNTITRRFIYTGTVGSTGIGTWQDTLNNPTASQESGWGWWYNAYFKSDEINAANTDNIDIKIKYDPSSNEPIVLGGYILDTTNGYLCIKFANTLSRPTNAKIAVDITITRNQVS